MKKIIYSSLLSFVLALAVIAMVTIIHTQPPMKGYIDSKNSHPAYYPVHLNTPTVYCLGITSLDGNRAAAWTVSKRVYDSYNIGDMTGKPSNVTGGDF